ncbi:hypothetical protein TrST_g6720 [Triparma strigata]|uniref:Uncharacterized protein n=1 Tax=Triparma strigata TaxID=1606541 RepID=A0A9W7C1I1_9STRA|nr:hypothetical protein TrST_g6720 [Triparma strigata]
MAPLEIPTSSALPSPIIENKAPSPSAIPEGFGYRCGRRSCKRLARQLLTFVVVLCLLTGSEAAFQAGPAVVPDTLVAGATSSSVATFTTGTAIPADGKVVIEFPAAFFAISATSVTAQNMDGTLGVAVSGKTVTITRSGGTEVAQGTAVTLTIPACMNQKFAGSSGSWAVFKTTDSTDTILDEATGGDLPAAVTFTPSTFGGNAGAITPASLVAGAVGSANLVFTTSNPLPADGKIVLEFPTTFHTVAATSATAVTNIDGSLSASTTGRVVTITRSGGSEITAGTEVTVTIPSVTNQKYEGSSGAFVALYTTLSTDVKIDEATSGSSTLPPAVTFTPSTFGGNAGAVTPASLVAGAVGSANLVFTTSNPLPADGKIVLEFPTTFHAVAATSATAVTNIDGSLSASTTGRVVTITRSGGSEITAGTEVTVTIPSVTNQKHEGSSGAFVALYTTISSGAKIDEATSGSSTLPPAVTFTPSTFGGVGSTVTPASLVAGGTGSADLVFTTGNPIPADGKIVVEFPMTFVAVSASAATAGSGIDGSLTASTSGRAVTITRSGDGAVIAAGTEVTITIPSITNQKYEGSSGVFVALKTTLSDGSTRIDEATSGTSTLPSAVTFTPSTFGGIATTVTPASLVAGASGNAVLVFTTENPIPADGKIVVEFPTTFHAIAATAATPGAGIDGNLAASSTGRAVTITRSGGSEIAAGVSVTITLPSVTNQKYEGSSGVFVDLKTTLSDGSTRIDQATAGSSTLPSAVVFTPSGFSGVTPTLVPVSSVAGEATSLEVTFRTANPWPRDGKLIFTMPNTFHSKIDNSQVVSNLNNVDGTMSATITGTGPWTLTCTRSSDGSEVAAGVDVTLRVTTRLYNQKFEGASGAFPLIKTTLADGTTAIDESSAEADAIGGIPGSITFTPSGWGGTTPTVVPVSLIAGAVTDATITFTTANPWTADGKLIFEVPDTFTNVGAASVAITSGVDGTFTVAQTGTTTVLASTLKTAGGPWVVTITGAGDGTAVAAGGQIVIVLTDITNQQHEGSSGTFPLFKTTLADGTTAIDESSVEADAFGIIPPAVTFTPSGWGGTTPSIVPVSLIAGAVTDATVTFTTGNPWTADGKLIFEVPDTFTNVGAASVAITSGIDGTFAVAQTGTTTVLASTLKTAGGSWIVTITRAGDGATVATGTQVVIVLTDVTNQQHEGSSGTFPLFKTTLADGTTAIDESSAEADAFGIIPPAVTFTPSGWGGTTPTIVPVSLIAGAVTDATVTFTTGNPWTADGKLIFEVPDTFTNVVAASVAITSGIDGTFTVAQTGTTTTLASTLKTAGGSWVVTITRAGDGATVATGTQVVIVLSDVTNQQHEGSSGIFPLFKTTLSDGTTAIDESSAESDSFGVVPPAVTFVPSAWGGTTPTIVPVSLVAGAVTGATITFTTGNPWTADGKLIFEVPDTFTNVVSASVAITSGIDGTFAVAQTGTTTTLASTLKTAGGSWIVTITRAGDGATVATGTQVVIVLTDVTNQQHEGSSGTFPLFKTTLADGTTAIDESSAESDSFGVLPPAITFTPSGFSNNRPTVVPQSLIAGDVTDADISFVTENPIPSDGMIIFEVPSTFTNVVANSVTIGSGIDGTFVVTQSGTASTFASTLKTAGGNWVVSLNRQNDGSTVPSGTTVSIVVSEVVIQQFEGPSGDFPFFKTTLADGTTAIDESSGETDAIGLVPASVTFTPSAFTYTEPTFVPHSLIAGAETQLRVTFTIQNPLRIDDKIIFEIPDTFSNVSATAVTPVSGVDGTFLVSQTGAKSVYDNTRKTSGGPWTVTIERAGDGTTVEEDVEVIIDLAHVYNQQFEGPSGTFPMFKTTLNDGTSAIDESSAEADALGTVPPSITWTPSGFGGVTPTAVSESLVAGDTSGLQLTFTVQNPLPPDCKIWIEVPNTYTDAAATAVRITSGIDGGFTVAQTGTSSVYDNTLKTSGGTWVVEITRDGTGTTVAIGTVVEIIVDDVTTMQFEGPSGVHPMIKTTLADGTSAIDESSSESDAIGTLPPSVTIVPATFLNFDARPDYLVAGLNSTFSFSVTLKNPIPVDAMLEFTLPSTFQLVDPSHIYTDMDGTFAFETVGSGPWVVKIRRNGDGTVMAAGDVLNFDMNRVVNKANIGQTGSYTFVTYLNDETTRIDAEDAPTIHIDKQIVNVGVAFGSTTVAVRDQVKRWYFHGYGLNSGDQIKWVTNGATEDHHCDGHGYSTSVGSDMSVSSVADNAVEFSVLFYESDSSADGPWKMCYKFFNETTPWKLYSGMTVEVREFYDVASAGFGADNVAVAHEEKMLTLNGFGVADGDQVKWIDTDTQNCTSEGVSFVDYRDTEWHETAWPTVSPTAAPVPAPPTPSP